MQEALSSSPVKTLWQVHEFQAVLCEKTNIYKEKQMHLFATNVNRRNALMLMPKLIAMLDSANADVNANCPVAKSMGVTASSKSFVHKCMDGFSAAPNKNLCKYKQKQMIVMKTRVNNSTL